MSDYDDCFLRFLYVVLIITTLSIGVQISAIKWTVDKDAFRGRESGKFAQLKPFFIHLNGRINLKVHKCKLWFCLWKENGFH